MNSRSRRAPANRTAPPGPGPNVTGIHPLSPVADEADARPPQSPPGAHHRCLPHGRHGAAPLIPQSCGTAARKDPVHHESEPIPEGDGGNRDRSLRNHGPRRLQRRRRPREQHRRRFRRLPASNSGYTIAMVTHETPGDTFWDKIKAGAEQAAKNNGIDAEVLQRPGPRQAGHADPERDRLQGRRHRHHPGHARTPWPARSRRPTDAEIPVVGLQLRHRPVQGASAR